jgi:hypothetical protein
MSIIACVEVIIKANWDAFVRPWSWNSTNFELTAHWSLVPQFHCHNSSCLQPWSGHCPCFVSSRVTDTAKKAQVGPALANRSSRPASACPRYLQAWALFASNINMIVYMLSQLSCAVQILHLTCFLFILLIRRYFLCHPWKNNASPFACLYQNWYYWVYRLVLRLAFQKEHTVSEIGSAPVLRWKANGPGWVGTPHRFIRGRKHI